MYTEVKAAKMVLKLLHGQDTWGLWQNKKSCILPDLQSDTFYMTHKHTNSFFLALLNSAWLKRRVDTMHHGPFAKWTQKIATAVRQECHCKTWIYFLFFFFFFLILWQTISWPVCVPFTMCAPPVMLPIKSSGSWESCFLYKHLNKFIWNKLLGRG